MSSEIKSDILNWQDSLGYTALMFAVESKNSSPKIVKQLIDAGASVNIATNAGFNM